MVRVCKCRVTVSIRLKPTPYPSTGSRASLLMLGLVRVTRCSQSLCFRDYRKGVACFPAMRPGAHMLPSHAPWRPYAAFQPCALAPICCFPAMRPGAWRSPMIVTIVRVVTVQCTTTK